MPIDFRPIEKILTQIRNLETSNQRIAAEARRDFEHRGGVDDAMFHKPDLARRLYICHNAVFFLHVGLVGARIGIRSPEELVPGAEGEARELWLKHLVQIKLEDTLHDLLPQLLQLALRAPTADIAYPLLPVPGPEPEEQSTEPLEHK